MGCRYLHVLGVSRCWTGARILVVRRPCIYSGKIQHLEPQHSFDAKTDFCQYRNVHQITVFNSHYDKHRRPVFGEYFERMVINTLHSRQWQMHMSSDVSAEPSKQDDMIAGDIEVLVDELIERASELDKMVTVVPSSTVSKHVVTLLNAGFQDADVRNLYKFPNLIKNLSQVTDVIMLLLEYGLLKDDITHIVKIYPDIVFKAKADVLVIIKYLQDLGFSTDSIVKMICNHPSLLDSDMTSVPQRIEDLKLLFKTKDTFKLLEKLPTLLFCDMEEILQRFNYVFVEMGITQPQMMYSNLFSYPIEHIHARHMFLVRAGYFKKMLKTKGQIDLNPKLDNIIGTSDTEFVMKFGDMTVKDYKTFKKLLLKDTVILKDVVDIHVEEDQD